MLKFFGIFRKPRKHRRYVRIYDHSDVKFRVIDRKNPASPSQIHQGKVLHLSSEGLCIGTTTAQKDLHVFHPSLHYKDRLEMEVDLDPCMAPMKTFGEVKWYMLDKNERGLIYKMGIKWLSMNEFDRQTLNNFLETKMIYKKMLLNS